MKHLVWIAALVLAIAFGIWWPLGGQTWLAIHTGTNYCATMPPGQALTTCRSYGFWSGFGSVIPWSLFSLGGIFAGLYAALRAINCHQTGCARIGRYPIAGGRFKYCGKHHPDWEGKHPPRQHILDLHQRHRAATLPKEEHHDS